MHCNVHEPKSNPNFRVLTRNVEENQILHEKFLKASRFPLYISCYISENRLPLGQCAQLCIYLCNVGCIFNIIRLPCLDPSNWLYTLTPRQEPISSFREPFVIGWDNNTCRYREGWQGLDGSVSNKRSTPPPPHTHTERWLPWQTDLRGLFSALYNNIMGDMGFDFQSRIYTQFVLLLPRREKIPDQIL